MTAALESAAREVRSRVIAALAARFRDLDLAEEAWAEACSRAVQAWVGRVPADTSAWLYRVALRCALDAVRRRNTRLRHRPEPPAPEPNAEDLMTDDDAVIPDERLRLIFVCCHPAVAPEVRPALTLQVVCGLGTAEIARAFLLAEPTLAQRLVRAKRKIAEAGVPFAVPGPQDWAERLDAVLSTVEIAYSKAHEDAAGAGRHAAYADEAVALTGVLVELLPREPDVLALAATVRYAEARRPARMDGAGSMVPLSAQDPALWRRGLIAEADALLNRAAPLTPRVVQAAIHAAWCSRRSLREPAPWRCVLSLYDTLLTLRDDPVVRLNRAVALAEVAGVSAALDELESLEEVRLEGFLPYHAIRADLLRRSGRAEDARAAYAAALALEPAPAERAWLARRLAGG